MSDQNTIDRLNFFRNIQVLPTSSYVNYQGWLSNFVGKEEQLIANRILGFFMYFSVPMVDALFSVAIGRAGFEFQKLYSDWDHQWFYEKCIYSIIPGDDRAMTDSGHIYARKLRDVLGIPKRQILPYEQLHSHLIEHKDSKVPVVLVDDFVGTGYQCNKAWNSFKDAKSSLTLCEIVKKYSHNVVYTPMIANFSGVSYIKEKSKGLILAPVHILGQEYNIFEDNCPCWEGDSTLADKARKLFLRKSIEQDLSFDTDDCKTAYGFKRQGLAIAFSTGGVPDAISALFYHTSKNWTPLIPKRYD